MKTHRPLRVAIGGLVAGLLLTVLVAWAQASYVYSRPTQFRVFVEYPSPYFNLPSHPSARPLATVVNYPAVPEGIAIEDCSFGFAAWHRGEGRFTATLNAPGFTLRDDPARTGNVVCLPDANGPPWTVRVCSTSIDCGWPFLALRGKTAREYPVTLSRQDYFQQGRLGGAFSFSFNEPPASRFATPLPAIPIPGGFAANTLVFAAPFLLWALINRNTRRARSAVGRCATCGYDLSHSGTRACPECGSERATRPVKPEGADA